MSNIDLDKGGRQPQVVNTYLGPTKGWTSTDSPVDIEWVIEGGGVLIPSGLKAPIISPDWLVINSWTILGYAVGSVIFDIYKVTEAEYLAGTIPSVADSICGSAKPTLAAAASGSSSTLTGWTTRIDQNDVLALNIDSISSFTGLSLILKCSRSIGQFSAPLT